MPRAVRTRTQPTAPVDRETLRSLLSADPVRTAVVWDRVFQQPSYRHILTEGVPPKAVAALAPSKRGTGPTGVAIHAADRVAGERIIARIPPGPIFFHATEMHLADGLRGRAVSLEARPAWLYAVEEDDFVDLQRHDVRPVTADAASRIATLWEPDWPSERYVRSRIEEGPTAGIYHGGALVAWAMTHFVTDRVAMLGFFHVVEGNRRQGYAKSVASALTREVLQRGRIAALHVYEENEPSLHLVEQLGYDRVTRQVWGEGVLR